MPRKTAFFLSHARRGARVLGARAKVVSSLLSFALGVSVVTPALAQTGAGSNSTLASGRPIVVQPELVEYVAPVYPKSAEAEGKAADVKLFLTIDIDGTVAEATVAEPVGSGFDEAAVEAALKLKFHPATVNGEPRKVKIGFSYHFELAEREKPVEELPPPTQGNLLGRVTVSGTETPLVGVKVSVVDRFGKRLEAATDSDGRYAFEGVDAGLYSVTIEADGFRKFTSKEEVVAGEAVSVAYRMTVETEEVEVVVEGERPPREVTRRTLQRREIERIPGTSGDALRSIQSLPGVARPPGLAGLLIVRGAGPNETETFVDGTNVPLIYHFGGLSSVIPTELLDKIDFYPGNFSVRFGRLTGGVVDVGLRSPNTDCYGDYGKVTGKGGCYHGMAQVDLIDARFLIQGPVPGLKNWSFALAGRRSYIDTWLKPVLESAGSAVTSAPVYYDYQAIIDYKPRPGEKLSFRFFGSDDRFETIITTPSANDPGFGGNLRFGTSFTRAQVLYQAQLSKRVSLDTMVSAGTQSIGFALGGNLRFDLSSLPIVARSELGFQLADNAKLNVGLDFLNTPFDVAVRAPPQNRPGEASPGPLVTRPPLESQATGFSFRPGWYADVEWQPLKRLRVVPGVRVDYARDTGRGDFSPRFNARYFLVNPEDGFWGGKPLKTVLKGGIGKFSQPPQFQETDAVFGTPGLSSNNAIHYALGFEQGLTKQVELSVEGFYKDLYGFVGQSPSDRGVFAYNNDASGRIAGLETLLKYNADERFFGWVSYTLSESIRRNCPTCEDTRFQYDQTHILIILGSYRLGDGWEIGGRFRVVSGPLVTPTQRPPLPSSIYSGDAGSYVALSGQAFSERLPVFHQFDFRLDKRWQFRTWRLGAYLDIQNVYNNAAAEALVYNYNFSQSAFQTGLPILPSLGVRGEF